MILSRTDRTLKAGGFLFALSASLLLSSALMAAPSENDLRYHPASTISPEAAKELQSTFQPPPPGQTSWQARTQEDWDKIAAAAERNSLPFQQGIAKALGVTQTKDVLGGVNVLRIRPAHYKPSGMLLVYVHGGAYVLLSAKSAISTPALLANASGLEVISIDYTLAPRGNWRTITDQVLAVWKAVLATGFKAHSIGLFGDSAGGGLAAGSVLKMRDQGLPLPGALFLGSPWSDITPTGDTYMTLKDVDPILSLDLLSAAANAYAKPKDQHNPYVSPVYGDYSKPFPPTLIQGGTRELFLSNFVRQYQAIRSGGHEAILDLYEGMPHVFQALAWKSPESKTAVAREAAFFKKRLKPTAGH